MRITRLIFSIHSWSGLIAGLVILIFFLTGAVIVFRTELNEWQNPHLFKVTPGNLRLSYQTLYERARQQRPDLYLYSFRYVPQQADETIEMRVYDPAQKDYPLLYLNPYTGVVLGVERTSLYDILLRLHYQLYLGRIGEFLAAIFALALIASVVTGIIVYRKYVLKVLCFRVNINFKNTRVALSGLHRVLGVWTLLFNLLLAVSGFYMMLYVFDVKSHFSSATESTVQSPPHIKVNLDSAIHTSTTLIPGFVFSYMDFPRDQQGVLRVSGRSQHWLFGENSNYVNYDYHSNQVKEVFREEQLSALEKFEYALYTLHFGQYGGMFIKMLYSFLALCGSLITLSGFFLWMRRKKILQRR